MSPLEGCLSLEEAEASPEHQFLRLSGCVWFQAWILHVVTQHVQNPGVQSPAYGRPPLPPSLYIAGVFVCSESLFFCETSINTIAGGSQPFEPCIFSLLQLLEMMIGFEFIRILV